MKKILLGIALSLGLSGAALAAGAGIPLDRAPQRTTAPSCSSTTA